MRIFVRILLTFWLLIIVLFALITFVPLLSSALLDERVRGFPLATVEKCAQAAVVKYRQAGASALRQQAPECYDGRLLDPTTETVEDLSGRLIPPYGVHSVRRAKEGTEVLVQALVDGTLVVVHTDPSRADSLIYITEIPLPHSSIWHVPPIVLLYLAAGMAAFLAAAYFVRPITQLSKVAEQLGSGDLKARAPASLANRKDQLGDLSRVLNDMASRIDALVERYKSFLAQASHELGSPLTRLNIALALAQRKTGGQFAPELERIDYEASRLNDLVQEMLLLARLESGNELGRNLVLFSVDSVVQEACQNATFEAEQVGKSVAVLEMQFLKVRGYPDLLGRALDNVLRNALRFTPDKGTVEVACSSSGNSSWATIRIQDDGPGVPPGSEEDIFEPFVSLSHNTDHYPAGSGLGLAIARQAVTANGGQIKAHSLAGRGLVVSIDIPLAVAEAYEAVGK